ncbi:MAG: DUF3592 domain-containing protein [Verrucomicrobiota bacterium]
MCDGVHIPGFDRSHSHSTDAFSSYPASHQIGDEVVVLFHPESIGDARIRSFRTLWLLPTILGCFGLAFSSAGAFVFVAARRTFGSACLKGCNKTAPRV